jgi:hypothetical protein
MTFLSSNSIQRGNNPKFIKLKFASPGRLAPFRWNTSATSRNANAPRWISAWFLISRFLLFALAGALTIFGIAQPRNWLYAQQSLSSVNKFEAFDSKNFQRSTQIDNKYFPLKPGTQLLYKGFSNDEGRRVPHSVVFTVTDLTKVIGGVRSVVALEKDYSGKTLVEAEIVFFAQDNDGTVWQMGQYPEEYENGRIVGTPAWIHGIQKAVAGITMKADPQLGTPSYSQGWGPAVKYSDRGTVSQVGLKTCVPLNCYENVLVIKETSEEEPDAHQDKYHALGVGVVRVGWGGAGEKTQEILELVKVTQLESPALALVRTEALKLDKRAYKISKKVYAYTSPAEHTPGEKGQ